MKEVAWLFLKLGCLGFGGPIAVMAMMEDEAVSRRGWLTTEEFSRAYAIIKVLPGPVSTQMAIYLGQVRKGRWGGFIAGWLFVLPAFILILLLSIFYAKMHAIPEADAVFSGMQAAALIVIAESVWRMAKPYSKNFFSIFLFLIAGVVIFLQPRYEPLLVLGLGLIGAFWGLPAIGSFGGFFEGSLQGFRAFASHEVWKHPIMKVCLVCLKAGCLTFGTGLAIVPVLEADVVGHYHWLTHSEFIDGLALGQVTPGPVVITATFIGYKVAGLLGAIAATVAIFLPGFVNILLIVPALERKLHNSSRLKGFTEWAIPTVIGGIVATSLRLGIMTIHSVSLVVLLVVAAVVQFTINPPVWATIPVSGFLYFAFRTFFH